MSVIWKGECDDGKVSKISSDAETKLLFCSVGDKPHEATRVNFRILNLHISPEVAETISSYYLEVANGRSESEPVEIPATIGFTSVTGFDRLIDICLTKMVQEEIAKFQVEYLNLKADLVLQLLNFQNAKDLHEMTPEELLNSAAELKAHGVNLYTNQKTMDAFKKFSKALKFLILIDEQNQTNSIVESKQKLMTTLLGNLAACHVAQRNWDAAIDLCNSVLGNDPQNVKALFRRGISLIEVQEFEKARRDLFAVKELEPNNMTIQSKLAFLDDAEKAWKHKHASVVKKMFAS